MSRPLAPMVSPSRVGWLFFGSLACLRFLLIERIQRCSTDNRGGTYEGFATTIAARAIACRRILVVVAWSGNRDRPCWNREQYDSCPGLGHRAHPRANSSGGWLGRESGCQ